MWPVIINGFGNCYMFVCVFYSYLSPVSSDHGYVASIHIYIYIYIYILLCSVYLRGRNFGGKKIWWKQNLAELAGI